MERSDVAEGSVECLDVAEGRDVAHDIPALQLNGQMCCRAQHWMLKCRAVQSLVLNVTQPRVEWTEVKRCRICFQDVVHGSVGAEMKHRAVCWVLRYGAAHSQCSAVGREEG